jgi:hypothetical protein
MENEELHFPKIHRFSDAVQSNKTLILDRDYDVFGKILRVGTVLRIVGWREVNGMPFLIVTKGSWESLMNLKEIEHLIKHE